MIESVIFGISDAAFWKRKWKKKFCNQMEAEAEALKFFSQNGSGSAFKIYRFQNAAHQVESILFHFQQLQKKFCQKFPWNTAKMVKILQYPKTLQICYLRHAEHNAKNRTSLRGLDHDTLFFFEWPVIIKDIQIEFASQFEIRFSGISLHSELAS